jgi:phosphatidylserine/phosphatidylglycerophosphate/cardiolipin synthase-like enzyme
MFTWTHPLHTAHVIAAHQRGVQVEIIIDHHSAMGASQKTVTALQEAGIGVRLGQGPQLLHHKMAWVDEMTLILGSANWTKSAFKKNEDCFLILHDLSSSQRGLLDKLWSVLVKESTLE